ncbi:MAG: hypothetical protein UR98_C0003G0054 [Parcubacteria group bacterium GW2011_GWA1_36_12]|nr:MAG: hypothetical protein UR98_C0003G0054 [Parcubacteria group bacterium GW2011_GWA1_36_12]
MPNLGYRLQAFGSEAQARRVTGYRIKKSFHFSLFTIHSRRRRAGYTLIELLVVLGIMTMTVGALTVFLTSVFRGTNKANASAEVKQNGQAVLDSLERQIRGAINVVDNAPNYIRLEREFGDPLHIACISELTDNYKSRIAVAQDPRPILIESDQSWRSVSNDDWDNGISINPCTITVSPATISSSGLPVPAIVSISFTVQKDSERVEFAGKADFRTTISLRQY